LRTCPCTDDLTFCDNSDGTGEGHCQKCEEFKDIK
jgi:hypothetical protein